MDLHRSLIFLHPCLDSAAHIVQREKQSTGMKRDGMRRQIITSVLLSVFETNHDTNVTCRAGRSAFWGGDSVKKYQSSCFDKFTTKKGEQIWHYGDFVRFNPRTGGICMLGQSDRILKPAGVRFSSAEIYNIVLEHFTEEVSGALCIRRRRETDTNKTEVLFLKMAEGYHIFNELVLKIMTAVKKSLSARHAPAIVDE